MSDFYASYASYKRYETPVLGAKQRQRFDAEIWAPAACSPSMAFLELGCGTGAFLDYLRAKGVTRFLGIDHDPALAQVVPAGVRDHFACRDVWDMLADADAGPFDRVVALDVLEHFGPDEAVRLLAALRPRLAVGARMVIKVPNAACPWGLSYQFGDLTHRTAFSPLSIRQLADAAGFEVLSLYPQRQGSRRRLFTDALVHSFLAWALLNPPQFWSANLYAILTVRA